MASTEDDPSQSSAALCISMDLMGTSFHPEFTHQCFEGEGIRGYQPMNLPPSAQHSSHGHHEQATHELQVTIQLSPSCRSCRADVQVQRKPMETRASKRPRLQVHAVVSNDDEKQESDETNATEDDESPEDDPDFQDSGEEDQAVDSSLNAGTTRTRRMAVEEILERCGKALPTIKDRLVVEDYLQEPIGTVVKEYQRKDMDFCLSLADGADAAEYHNEVQKLALLFIETADCVDLTPKEGYWKVLYLFCKHRSNKFSLVGYVTLFHFHSPFRKPRAGVVIRVCQALVLPPYQRMGHGKVLLRAVHELAGDEVVEINVEDPAPSFVCLRNRVDYERFCESLEETTPWLDRAYCVKDVSDPDFFRPVSDADAVQAGVVARITPRQVQIAHEIYKLSFLKDCSDEVFKQYRLMVKKRLARVHREDLGACQTKQDKQALLAKVFETTLQQYNDVLKKSG